MNLEKLIDDLVKHKNENRKTWKQIAEESGVSFSLITKIAQKNRTNPTIATYEKLAVYLKGQAA